MKKKCCFVVPYFGKLPNYFQLFLKTCATNIKFDWLIITDDKRVFDYPKNVHVIYMDFYVLRQKIANKFDFPISLESPYKLCDFKPTYGYVFEEELKDYLFWGHCDIDTLMGDLEKFLPDDFICKYDKLFCLGHMTIYRNCYDNNCLFMSEYKGKALYKEVLSCKQICWFDEEYMNEYNINRIFLFARKRVFQNDFSLNMGFQHNAFEHVVYVGFENQNNGHGYVSEKCDSSLHTWENGHILQYTSKGDALVVKEFMYIHLQSRKFNDGMNVMGYNKFKIVPNKFMPLEYPVVSIDTFHKIRIHYFCIHYFQLHFGYKYKKLKGFISNLVK